MRHFWGIFAKYNVPKRFIWPQIALETLFFWQVALKKFSQKLPILAKFWRVWPTILRLRFSDFSVENCQNRQNGGPDSAITVRPMHQKESFCGIIWPFRTIPQVKIALDGILHGAFEEKWSKWAQNDPFSANARQWRQKTTRGWSKSDICALFTPKTLFLEKLWKKWFSRIFFAGSPLWGPKIRDPDFGRFWEFGDSKTHFWVASYIWD